MRTLTLSKGEKKFIEHSVNEDLLLKVDAEAELIILSDDASIKYSLKVVLDTPNSSLTIRHLILTKNKTEHDVDVDIVHKAKRTNCDYKLFAFAFNDSKIKAVAKSKIEKGMSGSETHQLLKMLTDDKAKTEAQPGLLIDDFDVIASHGNSIGQLDQRALYYLETKGIKKDVARWIIVKGIVEDLLGEVAKEHAQKTLDSLRNAMGVKHG